MCWIFWGWGGVLYVAVAGAAWLVSRPHPALICGFKSAQKLVRLFQGMELLLKQFASVTASLSKSELAEAERLAVVGKLLLKLQAEYLVASHPDSHILLQYSADCTPTKVLRAVGGKSSGGSTRASSVSSSAELLVQQLFVTVASGGSYLQRVIFTDPVE
eukprot:692888-Amphidinium_carterae.1